MSNSFSFTFVNQHLFLNLIYYVNEVKVWKNKAELYINVFTKQRYVLYIQIILMLLFPVHKLMIDIYVKLVFVYF